MRGAAGVTSSLWVRPPSAFDCACAERPPPLLDPLPRRGRGIRKRGCAMRLPAAMQRPGAREGLRDPARGARRTAALLVLEAAPQATVDRGCHSERSLRSEESTRSDLPAASAQAGQGERDATAKAVSIPAAMQWPRAGVRSRRRTPRLCHSRARCAFFFPSPLGGRGKGEGGCWRHLEPLGASPPLRSTALARSVPPLPSTPLARCVPPLLDPLPRRGRGIRKRGVHAPPLSFPRGARRRAACRTNGSAMPRRRPSPSLPPCNRLARARNPGLRRADKGKRSGFLRAPGAVLGVLLAALREQPPGFRMAMPCRERPALCRLVRWWSQRESNPRYRRERPAS